MTDRPILFSAPMVRAILDGRKTQTRRVVKPQPYVDEMGNACWNGKNFGQSAKGIPNFKEMESPLPVSNTGRGYCPYGQPGDRLWVRETWCDTNYEGAPAISYKATQDRIDLMEREDFLDSDGSFNYDDKRLLFGRSKKKLRFDIWCHDIEGGVDGAWKPSIHMPRWASRITLEITDVRVERLQDISDADALAEGVDQTNTSIGGYATERFKRLWQSINGPESWASNPWVWVIEFKRVAG